MSKFTSKFIPNLTDVKAVESKFLYAKKCQCGCDLFYFETDCIPANLGSLKVKSSCRSLYALFSSYYPAKVSYPIIAKLTRNDSSKCHSEKWNSFTNNLWNDTVSHKAWNAWHKHKINKSMQAIEERWWFFLQETK